jgi:hypothetical protein
MVRPSDLAVLRLMTNSNLADWMTGNISARPVEGRNQPSLHHIGTGGEYYWNLRSRGLRSARHRLAASCRNNRCWNFYKFCRQRWKSLRFATRRAVFDRNILPSNKTSLLQTLAECSHECGPLIRGGKAKIANYWQRLLLRLGAKWARRCRQNKCCGGRYRQTSASHARPRTCVR